MGYLTWSRIVRKIQKSRIGYKLMRPVTLSADVSIFNDPNKLIDYVKKSIADAADLKSKLTSPKGQEILQLFGQISEQNRHLLNNLCSIKGINYLEIGTYQGTSFVSANYGQNHQLTPLAIDNWSEFGGPSFLFFQNAQVYIRGKYKLIWRDCWQITPQEVVDKFGNNKKAHVYLYDADHSYESQRKAFTHYNEALNDLFVAIVDDYNIDHVRKGTQDAFKELNYEVLFEQHLTGSKESSKEDWWNGYYVAVIRKKNNY